MDLAQLRDLAASVGFPDPELAAAIAMAESGGNPNAVGDLTRGRSIGLWQINLAAHPNYDEQSLFDATTNANAALAISANGTNWKPWSTYGYDRAGNFVGWGNGFYLDYYSPASSAPPSASGLTTTKALWISAGILAVGGSTLWWLSRSPREKRRIRRMLPV